MKFSHSIQVYLFLTVGLLLMSNSMIVCHAGTPGDLYILSIGVDPEKTMNGERDWYAQDAGLIRQALSKADSLYASVHSRVLNGSSASRQAVLAGLNWIETETRKQDTAIIFFSTHGEFTPPNQFKLSLTYTLGGSSEFLNGSELQKTLVGVKGKAIVLMDACNAGGFPEACSVDKHQAALLLACGKTKPSTGQIERFDRPHGFFVIAVCEALNGMADTDHNAVVTFQELVDYLPNRTQLLAPNQVTFIKERDACKEIPLATVDYACPPRELWTGSSTRNPFQITDICDMKYDEILDFAQTVNLPGDANDPNSAPWADDLEVTNDTLDGSWKSRWNSGPGTAWNEIPADLSLPQDVFILFSEDKGQSGYLIEAKHLFNDWLVGRYINITNPGQTSPWIGRIISNDRIDGIYDGGRWDLRRKLTTQP